MKRITVGFRTANSRSNHLILMRNRLSLEMVPAHSRKYSNHCGTDVQLLLTNLSLPGNPKVISHVSYKDAF
jgi:hypothetical protein